MPPLSHPAALAIISPGTGRRRGEEGKPFQLTFNYFIAGGCRFRLRGGFAPRVVERHAPRGLALLCITKFQSCQSPNISLPLL